MDGAMGGGSAVGGAVGGAIGGAISGAVGGAVGGAIGGAISGAAGGAVGGAIGGAISGAAGGAVGGAIDGAVAGAIDGAVGDTIGGEPGDTIDGGKDGAPFCCSFGGSSISSAANRLATYGRFGVASCDEFLCDGDRGVFDRESADTAAACACSSWSAAIAIASSELVSSCCSALKRLPPNEAGSVGGRVAAQSGGEARNFRTVPPGVDDEEVTCWAAAGAAGRIVTSVFSSAAIAASQLQSVVTAAVGARALGEDWVR